MDSLPLGSWLSCFKFLVLNFCDDTVFICIFGSLFLKFTSSATISNNYIICM